MKQYTVLSSMPFGSTPSNLDGNPVSRTQVQGPRGSFPTQQLSDLWRFRPMEAPSPHSSMQAHEDSFSTEQYAGPQRLLPHTAVGRPMEASFFLQQEK